MKKTRKRLKSKRFWSKSIFDRFRIKCTYEESNEIIQKLHKEFLEFVKNKHRDVRIPNLGTLSFKKMKPLKPLYILKDGSRQMIMSHHTQRWCYRYTFKFKKTNKVKLYRFTTCRKEKRELSEQIFNRELRLP